MLNCYIPRRAPQAEISTEESLEMRQRKREDGRDANQLRRVYMELGVVNQASGSSYIELSHTKVICAVYGPRAQPGDGLFSEEGQLRCDVRIAPFAAPSRSESRGQSDEERELCSMLQQALVSSVRLELLTKSAIDIYVTVLSSDGGILGASIVCASLALADASIELYDIISACTAAYEDDEVLLDPTDIEQSSSKALMMVAMMSSSREVTQWQQQGCLKGSKASNIVELCMDGCISIAAMMRKCLISKNA